MMSFFIHLGFHETFAMSLCSNCTLGANKHIEEMYSTSATFVCSSVCALNIDSVTNILLTVYSVLLFLTRQLKHSNQVIISVL